MNIDPEHKVIKLCTDVMHAKGKGREQEALNLFTQARSESSSDFEKFNDAHFISKHQQSAADRLKWNETALSHAEKNDVEFIRGSLPSLFLNMSKRHEDLNDFKLARTYSMKGYDDLEFLPEGGYSYKIKSGMIAGMEG